jgi:hypothetical protein
MLRHVSLKYHKSTGKFYTEATLSIEDGFPSHDEKGLPSVAYMPNISEEVKLMASQGRLPGLTPGVKWSNGFIYIECAEGYPMLVVPQHVVEYMASY